MAALKHEGVDSVQADKELVLSSGLRIHVELEGVSEKPNGFVLSSTRIVAWHSDFFPDGLVEFQHSMATSIESSLLEGFRRWARMDLVTIQDAMREKPESTSYMEMSRADDAPGIRRRIVLGPVEQVLMPVGHPQGDHPFCPCCFITKNFEAWQPLFDSDATLGVRFYAARSADGSVSADCRINGEDFPEGKAQLMEYAKTWPDGAEIDGRKQYVVLLTVTGEPS